MTRAHILGGSMVVLCTVVAGVASAERPSSPLPGQYIVTLAGPPQALMATAALRVDSAAQIDRLAARYGANVGRRYTAALHGFVAQMTPEQAATLAADPSVSSVSPDTMIYGDVQTNATWGLDRMDQRTLPLDSAYHAIGDGSGVTVYVIDSGILISHQELAGRVLQGAFTIQDGRGVIDCHGHGTHVAGTIAGTTYGVAKKAKVVPVRVLDCNNAGTQSDLIAGIDWVIQNRVPNAVVNISSGGAVSPQVDTAIANLVASGVTTVVSAGNNNADACTQSPARAPAAITVGATTTTDARAAYSNHGACLDLFAPGTGVLSAGIASDTATRVLDGTSMAAPHVTGLAAAYLSVHPMSPPVTVAAALAGGATKDRVGDARSVNNLLANNLFLDAAPPEVAIVSPLPYAVVGQRFVVEVMVSDVDLADVQLFVDGDAVANSPLGTARFEVQDLPDGTHDLEVAATDGAGRLAMKSISVTVRNSDVPRSDESPEIAGGCTAGRDGRSMLPLLAMVVLAGMRRRRALRLP